MLLCRYQSHKRKRQSDGDTLSRKLIGRNLIDNIITLLKQLDGETRNTHKLAQENSNPLKGIKESLSRVRSIMSELHTNKIQSILNEAKERMGNETSASTETRSSYCVKCRKDVELEEQNLENILSMLSNANTFDEIWKVVQLQWPEKAFTATKRATSQPGNKPENTYIILENVDQRVTSELAKLHQALQEKSQIEKIKQGKLITVRNVQTLFVENESVDSDTQDTITFVQTIDGPEDLHIALRCGRCLRQVRIRISIPSTVRVSGTNFPLNISYYLVLHHYNRFLCDNCYGHLQSLFDNYLFPVDNLDRLLFSPIIHRYNRARITSNHPVPAINYPQHREDLIDQIPILQLIIDDVSIARRPLQQIVVPTQVTVTPAFNVVVEDILSPCDITSDSCSTYTIDFAGCCYPPPAYIAFDDTDSERMSIYTTKSNQLWAWKRRENRNRIYDLRRSIGDTNISIEKHVSILVDQPTSNKSEEQFDLKRHTYTSLKLEDLSGVSDTSSTVSVPKNFELICPKLNMKDLVGDAVPPNTKVADWIIDNQYVELDSVRSYASGPSKTSSVNRSHSSVELLYQCRKSDDYDTDSTMDPICEWLMNQPPNSNRSMPGSASGLTERIISYNDSPQSFSSFPLGQSEDEIYEMDCEFPKYESLNYASIATNAQLQNEIISIASTSLTNTGNESDVTGTNTIRFSDTSSNSTRVLGEHENCDCCATDSPNSSGRADTHRVDTSTSTDEI
ncbi:hypothetical protein RN001_016225 [Aquatica leii]|uniref:Uncharacterized protein n=1 Tax=Aquatica leii TaxID=1421715 RepID=A0AAN7S614_9COLE|nr:hypothetical protein RN001_016225 [Aquatica leii]